MGGHILLSFDVGPIRFQYRVAAIAVHQGHLLVAKADGADHCFLPGGRVEAGETSAEALRRELREELAVDAAMGRLVWVVENFFPGAGRRYHEISLYFTVDLPASVLRPSFARRDPVDRIDLSWRPVRSLGEANLQPSFLIDGIAAIPEAPAHIIVRDA